MLKLVTRMLKFFAALLSTLKLLHNHFGLYQKYIFIILIYIYMYFQICNLVIFLDPSKTILLM